MPTLDDQDLAAHRIYCGEHMIDEASEDLICVDWEIHVGASVELHQVAIAHDHLVDAQHFRIKDDNFHMTFPRYRRGRYRWNSGDEIQVIVSHAAGKVLYVTPINRCAVPRSAG